MSEFGVETPTQLSLFAAVAAAYADAPDGRLSTPALYDAAADLAKVSSVLRSKRAVVDSRGTERNLFERAVRWHQQTLKQMGVIARDDGLRGVWSLVKQNPRGLHPVPAGVRLVAFSTRLGVAIWGDCRSTFERLDEPVSLVITSPPYCLARPRDYGNPSQADYVDFVVECLAPVVRRLAPHGSVVLNVGQDVFASKSPERPLINERLLIALHDRLGLHLMDRLVWHNPSKPPGPTHWSSVRRVHLGVAWEPLYWLAPNPTLVRADNRRVLEPHTDTHRALMARGGETRETSSGDGSHRIRRGSFGRETPGRIPRNVLTIGSRCADTMQYRRDATALRLPIHGAVMPLRVPDFLIRFLTEPADLVADPFGGSCTVGLAAERLGRRWLTTDTTYYYLRGSAERFRVCDGFQMPTNLQAWPAAA